MDSDEPLYNLVGWTKIGCNIYPLMKNPKISLIAALCENRVIGNKGKIPWHISQDLKRFKKLTSSHVVIMGRKTYESIERVLPNRTNIIVTNDRNYKVDGAIICNSLNDAIEAAKKTEKAEIFIIGGGQIFAEAIKFADKLYLTIVKGNFKGDTFFPDYSWFKKVVFKKESKDENYQYIFLDIET